MEGDYHIHVDEKGEFGIPHSQITIEDASKGLRDTGVGVDEVGVVVHPEHFDPLMRNRVNKLKRGYKRLLLGIEVNEGNVEDAFKTPFLPEDADYLIVSEEHPAQTDYGKLERLCKTKERHGWKKPVILGHPQSSLLRLSDEQVQGLLTVIQQEGVYVEYNPGNFLAGPDDVRRVAEIYKRIAERGIPIVYGSDAHDFSFYQEKWKRMQEEVPGLAFSRLPACGKR